MSSKKSKPPKGDKRPGAGAEPGVLGSLPSTRPPRIGRRRDASPANGSAAATVETPSRAKPRATATTASRPPKPRAKTSRARPKTEALRDGPRAVRSGSPSLERAASDVKREPERPSGPPKGAELVTTAVQAAGELAQIGFTVGGQALKRAVGRFPRP